MTYLRISIFCPLTLLFLSKNSIKLFRAYALAKTNDFKKAKTVVKNVLEETEFNRKTFFERTLNSARDSTFIADVKETLKKVGFE